MMNDSENERALNAAHSLNASRLRSFILSCALLFGLPLYAEQVSFQYAGIRQISIKNIQGTTTILPSKDNSVRLSIDKVVFSKRCNLTVKKNNQEVLVHVSKGWFFAAHTHCKVNIEARVPNDSSVIVEQVAGQVIARGLSLGQFHSKVVSGRIDVEALAAKSIYMKTVSGDLKLSLAKGSRPRITLDTVNGDAQLQSELPMDLKFKSVSGSLVKNTKISTTDKSGIPVAFRSVSGSLILK